MSWAQCPECGASFGGDWAFDRHRVNMTGKPGFDPEYDWRCVTPEEMVGKGWHQDDRGWWRSQEGYRARDRSPRTAPGQEVA